MGEVPFNEPLAQFPELARARDLFVALFGNDLPLINLGYTVAQRQVTKPVLMLIQEAGKVLRPESPNPSLYFVDDSGLKSAEITELPDGAGFSLYAASDLDPHGIMAVYRAVTPDPQPLVFDDDFTVAHIMLVRQDTIEGNLPKLVQAFYEVGHVSPRLRPAGVLGGITRALGRTTTFRTRWTDETQREFVVELKPPAAETDEIHYHRWRKLNSLSDFQGTVIPIGRKPSASKDKILEILNSQPERALLGQIQWQPGA